MMAKGKKNPKKCQVIAVTVPTKLIEAMDIEIGQLEKSRDPKAREGRSGIVRAALSLRYRMPDATELLSAGRPKHDE